ncbi:hypothetical protein ACEWPB_28850 (plasmid) [Priestia megaterium]|uniref:hypothetical protein n=1 Tax=Priestia megaterium TaxID=1404 RepID=UPI0035CB65AD
MDFEAKGKIVYDPAVGKAFDAWWVIIQCPEVILNYYHYWIVKETGLRLNKPLFGSHISMIRGEEPLKNKLTITLINNIKLYLYKIILCLSFFNHML